jgi:hypothetical protein
VANGLLDNSKPLFSFEALTMTELNLLLNRMNQRRLASETGRLEEMATALLIGLLVLVMLAARL